MPSKAYIDAKYQSTHYELFKDSITVPPKPVLPPGVTFTDLYDYCIKNKLNVWPSVPSLGWGSVIGNTLDAVRALLRLLRIISTSPV
jgi:hypothetical protein